ncbi:hypothetical protein PRIPAC_92267 [Pristionchus pacificus]|uniref:Uncharacterized protein n=1 Tax=Pristionchus pacificus TaxID=54126 RepID=A0A2A6CDZ9_PRIPA|nr:hypothetical protein PRIPAC_92267 [Pristionchus pacificus]|eukprot:PDM76339.1 hypothetical protein PRIPAC_39943 [Pristionchus pacificus]
MISDWQRRKSRINGEKKDGMQMKRERRDGYGMTRRPIDESREGRNKMDRNDCLRVGSLNVGSLNGRSYEVVDMMKRRRIDVLCVQETNWVGQESRRIDGYQIVYVGLNNLRNGVAIFIAPKYTGIIVEVIRPESVGRRGDTGHPGTPMYKCGDLTGLYSDGSSSTSSQMASDNLKLVVSSSTPADPLARDEGAASTEMECDYDRFYSKLRVYSTMPFLWRIIPDPATSISRSTVPAGWRSQCRPVENDDGLRQGYITQKNSNKTDLPVSSKCASTPKLHQSTEWVYPSGHSAAISGAMYCNYEHDFVRHIPLGGDQRIAYLTCPLLSTSTFSAFISR